MNWLDAGILAVAFLAARQGMAKGLGRGAFDLLGAGLGILAAYHFYDQLADHLGRSLGLPAWLTRPAAFLGLAMGTALACHLVGGVWARRVEATGRAAADRWAGAALGGLVGLLLCAVALVAWVEWPATAFPRAVDESILAEWLLGAMPALYGLLQGVLAPLGRGAD